MTARPSFKPWLVVLIILLCLSGITSAVERHVPSQYSTIQSAVDDCNDGDVVIIAPGTYTGNGNRDIDFKGKAITVCSIDPNDPNIVAATVINCQGTEAEPHRGFYFHNGEGSYSVLDGFTITNGYGFNKTIDTYTYSVGGGILCDISSPKVLNCIFINNSSKKGGGIFNYYSSPIITNCTFIANSVVWEGAAICNYASSPIISKCKITGNSVQESGGGISSYVSSLSVTNCIIVNNMATFYAGGIKNNNSNLILLNCTISKNSAGEHGGVWDSGWYNLTVTNCILWDNTGSGTVESAQIHSGTPPAINYCCIQGWTGSIGGAGNVDADPCFVNPGSDDFHLLPGSPCIDAGDNTAVPAWVTTDLDGNPRIRGPFVDMGAYESPAVIFVDVDAAGANDGSSWEDAYNYLRDALLDANSSPKPVEIRVAQGIYKPDENTLHPDGTGDREDAFQLINGLALYGGFPPGGGTWGERDPNTCETILSGDLDGNDVNVNDPKYLSNEPTRSENSYHIFYHPEGLNLDDTAIINGFTITGGNANINSRPKNHGGGIFNHKNSPNVTNCTFTNNSARSFGGGIYNESSSSKVKKCTFLNNTAGWGSGMHNDNSNPDVESCTFTGNYARSVGGGMSNWNNSNSTINNCTFSNNSAYGAGGGIYNNEVGSNLIVTNCTFINNSAQHGSGGGICNTSSSPIIKACTFTNNLADYRGGGMYNYNNNSMVQDCTFSNNSANSGGGMYNDESSLSVAKCTFTTNSANNWFGGGMYNDDSYMTVTNCIFNRNYAISRGGGIVNEGSVLRLTNCTFSCNYSSYGGAIYSFWYSTPLANNCIFWADLPAEIASDQWTAITYSVVQGGFSGEGNIDADPCFVNPDSNDFHLLQSSPCIDTGYSGSYFGLEPEPDGGRINMGAYGNTPEATCKGGLVLQSYNLVSKTRVGRTEFEYVYTMTLNNNSTEAVSNVVVELLDASANVIILDPDVTFAHIEAGESAVSDDTFSIIVDRAIPIDATIISWRATYDLAGGGGAGQTTFTTAIALDGIAADIIADGVVDFADLAKLAEQWLSQPGDPSADIAPQPDGDEIVNFLDFALFAENWQGL